jgi:hypothetical protein
MNIQDIRRANLRQWTEEHGIPSKEKSYFSQLLGGASFGERAARRIEADYGMGDRYLDGTPHESDMAQSPLPDLSPAAQALTNAISDADKHGISADVFNALRETLRLFRRESAQPLAGRVDVEDPSR